MLRPAQLPVMTQRYLFLPVTLAYVDILGGLRLCIEQAVGTAARAHTHARVFLSQVESVLFEGSSRQSISQQSMMCSRGMDRPGRHNAFAG